MQTKSLELHIQSEIEVEVISVGRSKVGLFIDGQYHWLRAGDKAIVHVNLDRSETRS